MSPIFAHTEKSQLTEAVRGGVAPVRLSDAIAATLRLMAITRRSEAYFCLILARLHGGKTREKNSQDVLTQEEVRSRGNGTALSAFAVGRKKAP